MSGLNKVMIIGRLGFDPELRMTPSGQPTCNLRVATSEKWKDKTTGDMKEQTEWHRCVLWGKQAENAGKYLKKGASVYLEGKIQTRQWDDQQGQKRYTTEIVAHTVQFLDSKSAAETAYARQDERAPESAPLGDVMADDDVPF